MRETIQFRQQLRPMVVRALVQLSINAILQLVFEIGIRNQADGQPGADHGPVKHAVPSLR